MYDHQVKEDIQLIREMVEKTKKATAESGNIFLFWGILCVLAIIGMYVLVFLKKFSSIWVNWVVFAGIGIIYSIFYAVKQERQQGMKTYAQIPVSHLGFACGIAFLLVGLIFPALGLYSYREIPVLVSVVGGILFFVTGGIYEWNLLKWCGMIWWLGAFGMVFVPGDYRSLIFIPLIIIGYLIPGLILRSEYRKNRAKDVS